MEDYILFLLFPVPFALGHVCMLVELHPGGLFMYMRLTYGSRTTLLNFCLDKHPVACDE
jgi:hypothetical protein